MNKLVKILSVFFVTSFFVIPFLFFSFAKAESIDELKKKIQERQEQIEILSQKANQYQTQINKQRNQEVSLENELSILDQEMEKNNIKLQYTNLDVERTQLEIDQIDADVTDKERLIEEQKSVIKNILQALYRKKDYPKIAVILSSDSISGYFNEFNQLSQIESVLNGKIVVLKETREELLLQRENKMLKKEKLDLLSQELIATAELLEATQLNKSRLLSQTKNNRQAFYQLYASASKERLDAESNIKQIEESIRKKLEEQGKKNLGGDGTLQWPTESRFITAKFHDPDYPFKNVFQHPAVDIRNPQGTNVASASDGYVAKVQNGGLYGYTYVLIVHAGGISTVYGHLSKVYVKADTYVVSGQTIGLSGGMPGTPGAGGFTTGPHLHFEVRKDGIPVDPLNYLP